MANELAIDMLYGVGDNKDISELYATFAEELQLQETLKESMIGSEKELEEAASEAIKKPECAVSHELSNPERTISQVSGIHDPWSFCQQRSARWPTQQRFGCVEQQRINLYDKVRDPFKCRKPTGWHNIKGRRVGDVPQTSSSNEFHAKTSSWGEGSLLVGTGNTEDPKGKGIAIDDGWSLVSKWKSNSGGGISAGKQRVDLGHPNHLKGSKDDDTNAVHEDDSDDSQRSHESSKKSKWFKEFFERMDALNAEEIDLWHCPACQGGPGATKRYRSISDLIAHSKNIRSRRMKVHRELAILLEGELCIRGTSVSPPADPIVGTWKGLKEDARDHQVVWPPMVVIMNTITSNSKDGKFVGMGSQELLEHFSSFPALKAQHSYGPQGHRGLSVLIFESSALGYLEAERLHQNFWEQRLDRFAWNSCTNEVLPGGERQLYGFMAVKEDLDFFNQHCQGKSQLKYELKSYQEAVLNEIKKMREGSQQLIRLKDKLEEERKLAKTLERSVNDLSRKLQQRTKDICIFERRVKSLHEESKEEMESQEIFYKDQIKILEARVKELGSQVEGIWCKSFTYRNLSRTCHIRPIGGGAHLHSISEPTATSALMKIQVWRTESFHANPMKMEIENIQTTGL